MPNSMLSRRFRPPVAALVVFLLAAVAATSLIWRLKQSSLAEARALAIDVADIHGDGLERGIDRALSATYALSALVRQGEGAIRDFDAVAGGMLPLFPGAASLQLAPRGVVRSIVPLAGNEPAIGHDLLKDPTKTKAAFVARDTGKLTLDGPFNLLQGGLGAVGRLPVFLDGADGKPAFWGFTSVLIRFPEVLEAAEFADLKRRGYAYELWRRDPDTGQKLVIAASSPTALIEPVDHDLPMPNATWTLSVAPVRGWDDPLKLSFQAILGLILSLLLSFVAKLTVELRAHEKGLEALVARRTAEVRVREQDLDRAQSIARIGSWVLDLAKKELSGSAEAYRIFGVSVGTPISYQAFLQRVHPEDREAVDRASRASLKGEPYDIDYRIMAGAAIAWVHSQAELPFDADGTPRRVVGTVQDITARKLAEQALRMASEQFRALVEQSIAGIYIIQDGKFAYANPRFAEIFGFESVDEVMRRDPLSLVAEQDRRIVAENLRLRLEGNLQTLNYSFSAVRKDGSTIEVGLHSARATYEGRPAIMGLMQDISEKKRAEEQGQRYLAELEIAFMSTVEVATILGEMRDPYTAGHERRVAEIAVAIGVELGFDARRQEGLRVAGYLHDIGKITIPSEILSKPGKLSAIEFTLIQGHSQASYDVLKAVKFPWPVAQVAFQHHERMDGSGYPHGLKGDAIIYEARILAVADVVEAMSSHRPYRPGLGVEKALAEIERGRGTLYDAAVVDACMRLFREKGYSISH